MIEFKVSPATRIEYAVATCTQCSHTSEWSLRIHGANEAEELARWELAEHTTRNH